MSYIITTMSKIKYNVTVRRHIGSSFVILHASACVPTYRQCSTVCSMFVAGLLLEKYVAAILTRGLSEKLMLLWLGHLAQEKKMCYVSNIETPKWLRIWRCYASNTEITVCVLWGFSAVSPSRSGLVTLYCFSWRPYESLLSFELFLPYWYPWSAIEQPAESMRSVCLYNNISGR